MPKDKRLNSLSSDRARVSPCGCSLRDLNGNKLESSFLPPVGDEKEWEEARCPICMEHPHNAVLLLCSSREKGCRPYMCDTSHRHSNCLDQFCKSIAATTSTALQGDVPVAWTRNHGGGRQQTTSRPTGAPGEHVPQLECPLCRGQITGWVVIYTARRYMNSKVRNCSLESCNFTGNYAELRKHARVEHPTAIPLDVHPERQSEWARLQRENDFEDALSAYLPTYPDRFGEYDLLDFDLGDYDSLPNNWNVDDSFAELMGMHYSFDTIHHESMDESSEDDYMPTDFDLEMEFNFSFLSESSFGRLDGWRNI